MNKLFDTLPYKDVNNFDVSRDAQVVVDTLDIFADIDLWDEAVKNNEFIEIGGRNWWLTTAENAITRGYNCHQIENNHGHLTVLNSFVIAKRQP